MGACLSSSKVSGSGRNNTAAKQNQPAAENCAPQVQQQQQKKDAKQLRIREKANNNTNNNKNDENNNRNQNQNHKRQGSGVAWGKRTDFGYAKDFDDHYMLGKLLGHGQFGYTYVATDKATGDRVAVKRIDKNKVRPLVLIWM